MGLWLSPYAIYFEYVDEYLDKYDWYANSDQGSSLYAIYFKYVDEYLDKYDWYANSDQVHTQSTLSM